MDTHKNLKKIIILGITLLIIAGIVIVLLRGFNVSLEFGKHEDVEIKIGSNVNLDDIEQIASETFGNKKFVVKGLEVFGDSAQISVESITDDEKENLIQKINEKYGTEKTVDDLNVRTSPKKRMRDTIRPFVMPMIISYIVIFVYIWIRFKKLNSAKFALNIVLKQVLIEVLLVSIIAIARIPIDDFIISVLVLVAICEMIYEINKGEKELIKGEE